MSLAVALLGGGGAGVTAMTERRDWRGSLAATLAPRGLPGPLRFCAGVGLAALRMCTEGGVGALGLFLLGLGVVSVDPSAATTMAPVVVVGPCTTRAVSEFAVSGAGAVSVVAVSGAADPCATIAMAPADVVGPSTTRAVSEVAVSGARAISVVAVSDAPARAVSEVVGSCKGTSP